MGPRAEETCAPAPLNNHWISTTATSIRKTDLFFKKIYSSHHTPWMLFFISNISNKQKEALVMRIRAEESYSPSESHPPPWCHSTSAYRIYILPIKHGGLKIIYLKYLKRTRFKIYYFSRPQVLLPPPIHALGGKPLRRMWGEWFISVYRHLHRRFQIEVRPQHPVSVKYDSWWETFSSFTPDLLS